MKLTNLIVLIILIFLAGCIQQRHKKIYIKSLRIVKDVRIDWYVFGSLAPDYLQINSKDKDRETFFSSFFISNIDFRNDTLIITLFKSSYQKFDMTLTQGIKVKIDTNGHGWNSSEARFGRLKKIGVDMSKPHFVDVSCPNGECY